MKSIITEELRYRQKACEFALQHKNMALAARRYHTSRQQVSRWLSRYDGTIESLRLRSRKPKSHANQHTKSELTLIKTTYARYGHEGLPQVYRECQKRGYSRSYGSMGRQIRNYISRKIDHKKIPKSKWVPKVVTFPGEKVQVDIKYVPRECIGFDSQGISYYQITAIDEFLRIRAMEIVDEKSVTQTTAFITKLEQRMGFKIHTVQTDNGSEFVNVSAMGKKETAFTCALMQMGIEHIRIRPYSPWQNGKVERSHRIDAERFYRKVFTSVETLKKSLKRYNTRYNHIYQKVLGFKSPAEVIHEYITKVGISI